MARRFSRKKNLAVWPGRKVQTSLAMFCCWIAWGWQLLLLYASTREQCLCQPMLWYTRKDGANIQEATFSRARAGAAKRARPEARVIATEECILKTVLLGGMFGV